MHPVDLFANTHPSRWSHLERSVEIIESQQGEFTVGDIHRRGPGGPACYGAARQAIEVLYSHGLLVHNGKVSSARRYWVHPAHRPVTS